MLLLSKLGAKQDSGGLQFCCAPRTKDQVVFDFISLARATYVK